MATIDAAIEPELSASEREELSHLTYLHRRVEELRDRNLIAVEACETILAEGEARRETILRHGRYRAALGRARNLATGKHPAEARKWADRARRISPESREAWELEIDLCWALEHDDDAIALCAEAADRFPEMRQRHDELCRERTTREMERARKAEQAREEQRLSTLIEGMRRDCKDARDQEAIALAREVLAVRPDQIEALATAALCLRRQGEHEEALGLYETLGRVDPGNETWTRWVREIRSRRAGARPVGARAEA